MSVKYTSSFEDYVKNIPTHINSILNFLEIKETIPLVIKPKNSFRGPKNQLSQYLLNNKTFRNISTKLIPTLTRDKIGEKFFVKQSTKPSMLDEDRERLKKIFLNEYSDLKNLLGIELPWKDYQ